MWPNALEVTGLTLADVPRVSVNGQPPSGRPPGNGEDGGFALWLDDLATGSDSDGIGNWPAVTVTVAKPGAGANGTDLQYVKQGRSFVRPSEAPVHDADGNLTQDAAFTYTWDAENRLITAEMRATGVPLAVPLLRVVCDYDAQGRRIAKRVLQKATPAGSSTRASAWKLVSTTQFWYDGWNLVAEVAVHPLSTSLLRTYAWGLDLSGTAQGAGGVGGLLGIEDALGHLYAVCTDANGNVMGLIESRQGQLVARFDYDPFGNLVTNWQAPGQSAAVCPFRFSTKYLDEETGLLYYGFRYYRPEDGRWLSRDPIGEAGGRNLYGVCGNNAVNWVDRLGLAGITFNGDNVSRSYNSDQNPAPAAAHDFGQTFLEILLGVYEKEPDNGSVKGNSHPILQHPTNYLAQPGKEYCELWLLLLTGSSRGNVFIQQKVKITFTGGNPKIEVFKHPSSKWSLASVPNPIGARASGLGSILNWLHSAAGVNFDYYGDGGADFTDPLEPKAGKVPKNPTWQDHLGNQPAGTQGLPPGADVSGPGGFDTTGGEGLPPENIWQTPNGNPEIPTDHHRGPRKTGGNDRWLMPHLHKVFSLTEP